MVFGRPFVKRFALCYHTVVCPVCLSVTLVYCGQTVGWIKMKRGTQVGLAPGHTLLDRDPASLPQGGTASNFRSIPVVAKWLDELRCHLAWRQALAQATCVRWGRSSPLKGAQLPQFTVRVYCGQTAGWMETPLGTEVDLGPGHIVLDGVPAFRERAPQPPPLF